MPRALVAALALVGTCAGPGCAEPDSGAVIAGTATVVDGDGLEISGTKIRLFGIDAPEIDQYCSRADGSRWRCGQYATVALDRLAGGRHVRCAVRTEDSYSRPVAVCSVGDSDLGAAQVGAGWAVAYRRYSDRYNRDEERARRERVGVWQGRFEMPWQWRERRRERVSGQPPSRP